MSTPDQAARPLAPAAEEVLRGIRDRRFATGICCPHCAHDHCVHWGSFSGRRRYRCRGCKRTFSDLTATALMYTKRLSCWREYLVRFRAAQTLRRVATALDIHVSTAFRWRHRVLRYALGGEAPRLAGWVELYEIALAESCKGTPQPAGTARRRGARLTAAWIHTPRARTLLARDRSGLLASFPLESTIVASRELIPHFSAAVAPGATLILGHRDVAPYLTAARCCGLRLLRPAGRYWNHPRVHVRNITAYSRRLFGWLRRFRGIATHYRERYFAWHRLVDGDSDAGWLNSCFGLVVPPTRPPPSPTRPSTLPTA